MDTWEIALIGDNEIRVSTQAGIAVEIHKVFYHVSSYYYINGDDVVPNGDRFLNDHIHLTRTWTPGDKKSFTHPLKGSPAWKAANEITQAIARQAIADSDWLYQNRKNNSIENNERAKHAVLAAEEKLEIAQKQLAETRRVLEYTLKYHRQRFGE